MSIFRRKVRSQSADIAARLGPADILVLAVACGLAAGEAEVAATFALRYFNSTQQLFLMTRHFVWLVPLIDMGLVVVLGLLLALLAKLSPRRIGWVAPRLIIVLSLLPVMTLAGPKIYTEAWLLLTLGIALRVAPMLERRAAPWRRWAMISVPIFLGFVFIQASVIVGSDRIKQWRENRRLLPAAGLPNVLLVVLDTARADHLSLYDYARPTSPNLERLARRGIRFDRARAAAPWTLASHANMFTGKWPHELSLNWLSPLRADVPTLAEHLGSIGYATGGFVGNTFYCSYDSGLDRGFTHYQDYILDQLNAARTSRLANAALKAVSQLGRILPIPGVTLLKLAEGERKGAHVVNQEFLDWLRLRKEPRRPFFAFLNYVDAHTPYLLPPGRPYRIGVGPQSDDEMQFLAEGWTHLDKSLLPTAAQTLARDAYDSCLVYLDEQLGTLLDDLERSGLLENTIVIVTADHGEGFGEHQLFEHGESLYTAEINVPLVIVLPRSQDRSTAVVKEFVSLRDLPATIVDLIGHPRSSPLPGRSLARFWTQSTTKPAPAEVDSVRSEIAAPNPTNPNQGRSPAYRGPLIALADGDFVYIRNGRDGDEELFNYRDDPNEFVNLARKPGMAPVLERFRNQGAKRTSRAPAERDRKVAARLSGSLSH